MVECSDAWETHHFATIIGYGASAIYPYLTYDTIQNAYNHKVLDNDQSLSYYFENFRKGISKGLLKILSKMGISTLQSYQSSQIFECIGLGGGISKKIVETAGGQVENITRLTWFLIDKNDYLSNQRNVGEA